MKEIKQTDIKEMIKTGQAVDVSDYTKKTQINEEIERFAISVGADGLINGLLLRGTETGKFYAIIGRTNAFFVFNS